MVSQLEKYKEYIYIYPLCSWYQHQISNTFIILFYFILFIDGFVTAMERHGFPGVSAFDIVETGKQVRAEMAKTDPKDASAL